MIINKSKFYLFCLFFFKLCVGAILLTIGWDSLGITNNSLINITIIMALSFFPATFARPLFHKFGKLSPPKLISIFLLLSSGLIFLVHIFMHKNQIIFFITNFILWIFIFVIEVATEKWFVSLTQGYNLNESRKLSGISTSIGQLGSISGPLVVMWGKIYDNNLPYFIIFSSFILSSIFSLICSLSFNLKVQNLENNFEKDKNLNDKKNWFTICFALIWPTLTIFNMSIPMLAKSDQYNSINVAGLLEVLIGIATAFSGFIHSRIMKHISHKKILLTSFLFLFLSSGTAYFYSYNFLLISLSVFILGLTFGFFRVELRANLSQQFTPNLVGTIVANANSWSGPFVLVYSIIFYFNASYNSKHILPIIFPLSFIICTIIFLYVLYFKIDYKLKK